MFSFINKTIQGCYCVARVRAEPGSCNCDHTVAVKMVLLLSQICCWL